MRFFLFLRGRARDLQALGQRDRIDSVGCSIDFFGILTVVDASSSACLFSLLYILRAREDTLEFSRGYAHGHFMTLVVTHRLFPFFERYDEAQLNYIIVRTKSVRLLTSCKCAECD